MNDLISTNLSNKNLEFLTKFLSGGGMLDCYTTQTISSYDKEYYDYLYNSSKNNKVTAEVLLGDIDAYLKEQRGGGKIPVGYIDVLSDCVNTFKRLRELTNFSDVSELTKERLAEIRACAERINGTDGRHAGMAEALANFQKASGYTCAESNAFKTMMTLADQTEDLTLLLETASIKNLDDQIKELNELASDTGDLLDKYEGDTKAAHEFYVAAKLKTHPDDVSKSVEAYGILENKHRVKSYELSEKISLDKIDIDYQNTKISEYEKQLEDLSDNEEKSKVGYQMHTKDLDTYTQVVNFVSPKLQEYKEERERISADMALLEKKISEKEASAKLKSRDIKKSGYEDTVNKYVSCLKVETCNTPGSCTAFADKLKTEKGRLELMKSGDVEAASYARAAQHYVEHVNAYDSGIFSFLRSPGEKELSNLIDMVKKDHSLNLGDLMRQKATEHRKAMELAFNNKSRNKIMQLSNEKMQFDFSIEQDKFRLLELKQKAFNNNERIAMFEKEEIDKSKSKENLTEFIKSYDNVVKNQKKEREILNSRIETAQNKVVQLKEQLEKDTGERDLEAMKANGCIRIVGKLNEFKEYLSKDESSRSVLAAKLKQINKVTIPDNVKDPRIQRITRRLESLSNRANENVPKMHSNSREYNEMINALKDASESSPENLMKNLLIAREKADAYCHAKGNPLFGKRSSFGVMRLNYAAEISKFCTRNLKALEKTVPSVSDKLREKVEGLKNIDLERDCPSLKERCMPGEKVKSDEIANKDVSVEDIKDESQRNNENAIEMG